MNTPIAFLVNKSRSKSLPFASRGRGMAGGLLSLLSALAVMSTSVSALTYTYNSSTTGVSTDWSTGTGWNGVPVSASDTTLVFGNGTALLAGDVITSNNDVGTFVLNSLTMSYAGPAIGTAPTVTITGGTLNFVSNGGTGPILNLNATGTVLPRLIVNSAVNLTDTLTVGGTSGATIGGSISGAGGITTQGTFPGTLDLTAANTYDGVTTINAGILNIANGQALGSTAGGTLLNGNGVLALSGGITVTGESLTIKGANGSGNLRNESGNNTWAGNILVESSVSGVENVRIVSNSGRLTITGNITLALETAVADQFVLQGAGEGVITGNITGTGRLVRSVTGGGKWTLSGVNDYSGVTTVSGGALHFAKRVSLYNADTTRWTASMISVASGAAFGLNVGGAGEFTASDITELMDINFTAGGRLALDTANSGGSFEVNVGITNTNLALIKQGVGVLILSAANAYNGLTTVSGGTLRVSHNNALGSATGETTVSADATLELAGGRTITGETLTIVGAGVGAQGAFVVTGGDSVWNGTINATTNVITRIGVGMADGDSSSLTVNGNIVATGNAANGLVFQGNGTVTVNGVISGPGAQITRSSNGTGALVLTGANTYTGNTTISNGTIQVGVAGVGSLGATAVSIGGGTLAGTGSLAGLVTLTNGGNAFISPGDSFGAGAGTLTLGGGLTLSAAGGGKIKFNLGTSSDKIIISGGTFTGNTSGVTTFQITPGLGFDNGIYDLIDWTLLSTPANVVGVDLADFAVSGLGAGKTATFQFDVTGKILQLNVVPEPGRAMLMMLGAFVMVLRRRR